MTSERKLLVGVDEAGYGPNLGPLVVAAVWLEVASDTRSERLWELLAPAVSRFPASQSRALVLDDSKKVYASGNGLHLLERAALTWLGLDCAPPLSLRELWKSNCLTPSQDIAENQWSAERDIELPTSLTRAELESSQQKLIDSFRHANFGRAGLACQIIMPPRFNRMLGRADSKGVVLFQTNAELLRHVWQTSLASRIEVTLDKHGGRNFYRPLLQQEFHESLVLTAREGTALSQYSLTTDGRSLQATFVPKADSHHMLVATASMVAKYIRELCMKLFNNFWSTKLPGLRPTAGYPVDAKRYWMEIGPVANQLGIPREHLWRER